MREVVINLDDINNNNNELIQSDSTVYYRHDRYTWVAVHETWYKFQGTKTRDTYLIHHEDLMRRLANVAAHCGYDWEYLTQECGVYVWIDGVARC